MLGADSTASFMVPEGGFHYLNFNQKLFQIGEGSALGALTWGLASLGGLSHRTQLALLADDLASTPASSVAEVATRWIDRFWPSYSTIASADIQRCNDLHGKGVHDPAAPLSPQMRTKDEETEYQQLRLGLTVGFCIAGYHASDRLPQAFVMIFDPLAGKPAPIQIPMGQTACWGAPKIFRRLILGIDPDLHHEILQSGKWSGTEADLMAIIDKHRLYNASMPIRDAVDFVHACISSTIKIIKSSFLPQVCGGPIELAVITTDRQYRWVSHKEWHAAIVEGGRI